MNYKSWMGREVKLTFERYLVDVISIRMKNSNRHPRNQLEVREDEKYVVLQYVISTHSADHGREYFVLDAGDRVFLLPCAWLDLATLWHKQPPLNPDKPVLADLDSLVAVGFGSAMVVKDDRIVFIERPHETEHLLSEFEALAVLDPDHDWQVCLNGPLLGQTFQRHGVGEWVLIASNPGFA